MKPLPLISIVVAVKDETNFLLQCINSLLKQDYGNVEILIVNDGSKPETNQLLSELKSEKLRIFHLNESKGQSFARNLAIEKSRGEFIAIADADDLFHPRRISVQIRRFLKNPKLDILGTGFKTINGYGWPLYFKNEEIKAQLLINNAMVHSSVMIRRSSLPSPLYKSDFDTAEDYELLSRMRDHWHFQNIRNKLVTYRIGQKSGNSIENQKSKARKIRQRLISAFDISPELLEKYHDFCELNPGITISDFVNIDRFFKNSPESKSLVLNKILYRHWAHYCSKNKISLGLRMRFSMLIYFAREPRTWLRLLFM